MSAPINACLPKALTLTLVAYLLACTFGISAPESPRERLLSLQAIYEEHLATLETEHTKQLADWPRDYTQRVQFLQKKYQKAGDLEGWTKARDELNRFGDARTISEADLVKEPADLRKVQTTYLNKGRELELERNQRIIDLAKQYTARIEKYQKRLTIRGNMEDALAYNAEIKRIRTSPEVTAAEFDLAERELQTNPPETDVTGEPLDPTNPAVPPADAAVPTKDGTIIPGAVVFLGSPPTLKERMDRIVLKSTTQARMLRGLTARAALHDSDSSYTRTESYSSSTKRKYVKTANTVYVSLRAVSSKASVTAARIVIQVFSKSVSEKGSVDAKQERIARVRLAELGTDWITVATPRVNITRYTRESSYSGSSRGGREFYGIVVSVFDGDGKLVYQGFEGNALEKLAPGEVPKEGESEAPRRKLDTARLHVWVAQRNLDKNPNDAACAEVLAEAKANLARAEYAWKVYLGTED